MNDVWGIDISPTRIAIAAYGDTNRYANTWKLDHKVELAQYKGIRDALVSCAYANGGRPEHICIERPAYPFLKAAFSAGMVCGRLEDAIFGRWDDVVVRWMQPAEWRKLAGLSGRATKDEVMAWSFDEGYDPKDQDQADASAIAFARWNEIL